MKQLIFLLLFTSAIFAQSGKSVLTNAQKDSIGSIISDSLNLKAYYVNPDMSDAEIQAKLDEIESDGGNGTLYFDKGNYTIETPLTLFGLNNLFVEGNGSTVRTTTTINPLFRFSGFPSSDYLSSPIAVSSGTFKSNILQGQAWVDLSDTSLFTPIYKGDIIIFSDSTITREGYSGSLFFFDRYEVISSDSIRMHFQEKSKLDIYVKDSISVSPNCYRVNLKGVCKIKNLNIENGSIQVDAFTNVLIDGIYLEQNNWDAGSLSQPSYAGIVNYARYIQLSNYTVRNYNKEGYGYGFIAGGFDVWNISNSIAENCRHGFTTTGNQKAYVGNTLIFNNCFVKLNEEYSQDKIAYDTHGVTVFNTYYFNCVAENASIGIRSRSGDVFVDGFTAINCLDFFYGAYQPSKVNYHLGNVNFQYTSSALANYNTFIELRGLVNKAYIDNIKIDLSSAPNTTSNRYFIFLLNETGKKIRIDTLIMKNCEVVGTRALGSYPDDFYYQVGSTFAYGDYDNVVGLLEIRNNRITNFDNFTRTFPYVGKIRIEGNRFEEFGNFFYIDVALDSTNICFNDTRISDNVFDKVKYLFDFNVDSWKLSGLEFSRNRLYFVSDFMLDAYNVILDDFIIDDNRFYNSLYNVSRFLYNIKGIRKLTITNNVFDKIDTTKVNEIITQYYQYGYTPAARSIYSTSMMRNVKSTSYNPLIRFNNNKWYLDANYNDEWMQMDSVRLEMSNNIISLDKISNAEIIDLDDSKADIYKNIISADYSSSNKYLVLYGTAGDYAVVDNTFVAKTYNTSTTLFDADDCILRLGTNQTYNIPSNGTFTNISDTTYFTTDKFYLRSPDKKVWEINVGNDGSVTTTERP